MKKYQIMSCLVFLLLIMLALQIGCDTKSEIYESESNRWLELLNVLPANEATLKNTYLQDTAYALDKVQQFPEIKDRYALVHLTPLTGQRRYNEEEWKNTLGFISSDVQQIISAGTSPLNSYEAVRGIFNRDDVDNAARTGPLNEILNISSYQDYQLYSWGGDHEANLSWRSNVRPFGIGHRLAVIEDFIFWTAWTDGMKEMLDSYENRTGSLGDIENYKLLTDGLQQLDTVNAFITSEPQSFSHIKEISSSLVEILSPEKQAIFINEIEREVRLKPYQALAIGAGIDAKGYYLAIVLLNPDENIARENTALLNRRVNEAVIVMNGQNWSELIENIEIQNQDRLTLAKLYGSVCEYWYNFELTGEKPYEPLLVHE